MDKTKCSNCGQPASKHCRECNACPGQHAYWCSKERR